MACKTNLYSRYPIKSRTDAETFRNLVVTWQLSTALVMALYLILLDYLLVLVVPLLVFLFSNLQIFSPTSKYVVKHGIPPPETDLLFSTKHFEVYANRKLAIAVVITASVLSFMLIVYFVYIYRTTPPNTAPPLWRNEWQPTENTIGLDELGSHHEKRSFDDITIDPSSPINFMETRDSVESSPDSIKDGWGGVMSHYFRPESVHITASTSPTPLPATNLDTVDYETLELPQVPPLRDQQARLSMQRGRVDRGDGSDESDWKTVYCEEWNDGNWI